MSEFKSLFGVCNGLSFVSFFKRLLSFVRNPLIMRMALSSNPLKYSVRDFFESLVYVGLVAALLREVFKLDVSPIINTIFAYCAFSISVAAFSIILATVVSISLFFKERKFHYLIFLQVIRAYAVLNFFVSGLFIVLVNRVLKTHNFMIPIDKTDSIIGNIFIITSFIGFVWLVLYPCLKYFREYFEFKVALPMTILIVFTSLIINRHISSAWVAENILDKEKFCEQLVSQEMANSGTRDPQCEKTLLHECINLPIEQH